MSQDVYAVIGNPVFHSLSPKIYSTLFAIYGLPAVYLPIELQKSSLPAFFREFAPALNLKGVNVTMPYKQAVLPYINQLDDTSSFLEAVNTIDCKTSTGYTTDGLGFVSSLKHAGFSFPGKHVVLMGCGGAGRCIAYAVSREKPASITVLNRTKEKAAALQQKLPAVTGDALSQINAYLPSCDLLINTTNLGMAGSRGFDDLSFLRSLPPACRVYDIIYHPAETKLLAQAKALGLSCQNGLDMLIYQAFHAFTLWFGITPTKQDKEKVLAALSAVSPG